MPLVNFLAVVQPGHQRAGLKFAGLRAKAHRAALFGDFLLFVQQGDDGVCGGGVKFGGVSALELEHVARKLDGGDLHPKAKAEVGDVVFAGELGCLYFALRAALAESARHQDAAASLECLGSAVFLDILRVDPRNLDAAVVGHAAVDHRLVNRLVGVLQFHVLAHDADAHPVARLDEFADDVLPVRHVGRRSVESKLLADEVVHPLALQHQRHFVNRVLDVHLLDHCLVWHVAEERKFLAMFLGQRFFAAANKDVRRDADFAQLGHALLGRLGLELAGGLDERNERDVQKQDIPPAGAERELPDRLDEGQPLNVADGAADLGDHHVDPGFFADLPDAFLDFIGHVRDDLHSFAEVITPAFLVQHPLINLSAGEVVEPGQLRVGEALVVAKVEIGLRAVVEHVHLAVLERAHRAGINIQVGIKLLQRDLESPVLQQGADGGRGQSLAEGTHHAACYEDVLHCVVVRSCRTRSKSSGVSMPTLSCSTTATAIAMPLSSARSCSSFSACSRGETGISTSRSRVSRR